MAHTVTPMYMSPDLALIKLKGECPRAEKSRAQANQCLEGVS